MHSSSKPYDEILEKKVLVKYSFQNWGPDSASPDDDSTKDNIDNSTFERGDLVVN